MKKKKAAILTAIAAGLLSLGVLAGCGGKKADEPAAAQTRADGSAVSARDTLTFAINNEPASLDPQNVGVVSGYQVIKQLYDTLVTRDNDGNIHPALAESWENIDDTTIRFKLRQDVVFHNGEKMTAEDVRYTIQRATELAQSASIFKTFDGENTKVVDDYTIDVKLKEPFAGALSYLATSRGAIVSNKAVEEKGIDGFGQEPVGSGPFKFVKWESGDRIVMVKNEDYWGDKATYENLIARIIPDASVRTMELESGGIDLLIGVNAADLDNLRSNPDINVEIGSGLTHEIWLMSMTADEFSDIRVREAMNLALDIPSIVETVWGELGTPADSVFSDGVFGHISIGPIKQDQEKAKELLAEAGYSNGFDTEITFGENAATQAALEVAQQMWAQVGINVKITPLDQATYKDNNAAGITRFGRSNFTTSTGDPDHALANWQSGYKGALNANDPHIDELMAQGRAEQDEEKRKEIYAELQKYCWDSYYSIPVVFIKASYAYTNKITNFEFSTSEQPDLAHIIFSE